MIGSWDESNCYFALAPNQWSKGNGLTAQTSGVFPAFPNGAYLIGEIQTDVDATLNNMTSGYGYVYNSGDGYLRFDGNDDDISTAFTAGFTDAGDFSVECWINYVSDGGSQIICSQYTGATEYLEYYITSSNQLRMTYLNTSSIVVRSTDTISDGIHHLVHIKDAGTLYLYIDGSEVGSYAVQDTYNLGNWSQSNGFVIGSRNSSFHLSSNLYWIAFYSEALSSAKISTNYGLGRDMSMEGFNSGDIMNLIAESDSNNYDEKQDTYDDTDIKQDKF